MPVFRPSLRVCEALLDLVELVHPAVLLDGPDDRVRELRDDGGTLGRVSLWEFWMATSTYEANVKFLPKMVAKAANGSLHGS
jgi:hypothetical protein